MDPCDCPIEPPWSHEELLVKYQYISDVLIAVAYFSIPIELIYFVKKSAFFPYRWVLMQFGAFIVLCGATHFINLWTLAMHSKSVAMLMAVAKILCAFVSCATALMLVHIIPDLLSVKNRESILKIRAEELDREMGLILTEEETGRHVRMLTREIRNTYDRDTILKTTLIELGKTLGLEECALWMPSRKGSTLQLSHTLHYQTPVLSVIQTNHPTVTEVFNSARAICIPYTSPLARIRPLVGRYIPPEVVAVRVPLLNPSDFQVSDWADLYAIMVLILPTDSPRKWRDYELELVEVVADQVAVALSHAAIIEESLQARDQLMQQNVALNLARQDAERAIHARNDFLAVMNHEMRTPTHALIALSSLLVETELTPEHRAMIETVLKSSSLLETLTNDVLDVSRLEDGSLLLDTNMFNLQELFKEVASLIKPMTCLKKLSLSSVLAPDLPDCALGDKERLMQIILNIVGNAVKYTKGGYISIVASVAKPDSSRDWRPAESCSSDGHFYLQVQVKDSGCGILPEDLPDVFTKFAQHRVGSGRNTGGAGLGLAICKRYVTLMGGHIWIESEGQDRGTKATFIVKLGHCKNLGDYSAHKGAFRGRPYHGSADLIGHNKPAFRDSDGMPSKSRYQRSL